MTLTEEEAKTKRCQEGFGPGPMSSEGMTTVAMFSAGATYAQVTSPSMCIASACMAWRWRDHLAGRGYCGKAGEP